MSCICCRYIISLTCRVVDLSVAACSLAMMAATGSNMGPPPSARNFCSAFSLAMRFRCFSARCWSMAFLRSFGLSFPGDCVKTKLAAWTPSSRLGTLKPSIMTMSSSIASPTELGAGGFWHTFRFRFVGERFAAAPGSLSTLPSSSLGVSHRSRCWSTASSSAVWFPPTFGRFPLHGSPPPGLRTWAPGSNTAPVPPPRRGRRWGLA
mmetsp:Transcript_10412/g.33277  ORF Transcript_10412/g.33277 Transcript_10412/m.33277 type:complete len:207 (-) Transcript_10412:1067-1687(-)